MYPVQLLHDLVLDIVASAYYLSIRGAEAGGLLQAKGWPGRHSEFKASHNCIESSKPARAM